MGGVGVALLGDGGDGGLHFGGLGGLGGERGLVLGGGLREDFEVALLHAFVLCRDDQISFQSRFSPE